MPELAITFLGTGTSQGIPVIACTCAVCSSRDARDRRTRSSIYVQTPECSFVVDTSTDFRTQCLREDVRQLDAVVYTHSHTDHIMGFDDLRPFCYGGKDMPIYGSAETLQDLRRVFQFAFNGENRFPGYVRPDARVVDGIFCLGDTEITPLPVPHGRSLVNGYLLKRHGERIAAYLSDCSAVPAPIIDAISGVQFLIIDALRYKPHPTHLSVAEAIEIARRTKARETHFTHMCHDLAHKETEAMLPENIHLAYDGLKLEI
jgi:phosphoribosyl 1,2-cyclic phosphate phosphodiesterase